MKPQRLITNWILSFLSPTDEVIMIQDFGENRKAAYSAEIKSAHFGKNQITVHPVVIYYRQASTVIRELHMFLSDDIKHDHHAVNQFTRLSIQMLLAKGINIKLLTLWSDGCASQYKVIAYFTYSFFLY